MYMTFLYQVVFGFLMGEIQEAGWFQILLIVNQEFQMILQDEK